MTGGTTLGEGILGQAASGDGTGGSGAGTSGCLDPVWMRAVTEKVRQNFYYPPPALATRTTGVVTVRFSVRHNGQIDRVDVRKSSGNAMLDKAATDIMRKAQPLPPIPERMQVARVEGDMPINFGVRNFDGNVSTGNCAR
jgi:protein TonB